MPLKGWPPPLLHIAAATLPHSLLLASSLLSSCAPALLPAHRRHTRPLSFRAQVRSSSPLCRFTDPRALLSGNFLPNNFAGPRLEEGGQLASWWVVDLGHRHSLVPNYYTLRHDGSSDFLRNWVLQVRESSWALQASWNFYEKGCLWVSQFGRRRESSLGGATSVGLAGSCKFSRLPSPAHPIRLVAPPSLTWCSLCCAALQGSTDGQVWVDLRRHIDDRRLSKPGQYASWPLVGRATAVPYRIFRVLLIGPNPEAQNPRHVCLSYIELYGYFYAAKD